MSGLKNQFKKKVNLDYLIAGSGIALTEKGQQKIEALRKNISLSDVIKYLQEEGYKFENIYDLMEE